MNTLVVLLLTLPLIPLFGQGAGDSNPYASPPAARLILDPEEAMISELAVLSTQTRANPDDDFRLFQAAVAIIETYIPSAQRRTQLSVRKITSVLKRFPAEVAELQLPIQIALCVSSSFIDFVRFEYSALESVEADAEFRTYFILTSVALHESPSTSAGLFIKLLPLIVSAAAIVNAGILSVEEVKILLRSYLSGGYDVLFIANAIVAASGPIVLLALAIIDKPVERSRARFRQYLLDEKILSDEELKSLNLRRHPNLCSWYLSAQSIAQRMNP